MAINTLVIQDKQAGDLNVTWDPDVVDEVAAAREQFDRLTKKGYLAYRVTGAKGAKGVQMRSFDPEAAMVILAPALRGG